MATTTLGRTFDTPDGKTFRPSMFVTLTLPSYGRVGPDGAPLDPRSYDYRRAARDAMHFGELVDRFWQNLRRACGWPVQYFAAVEPQTPPRPAPARGHPRHHPPHPHPAGRRRHLPPGLVASRTTSEVYPRHRPPSGTTAPAATSTHAPAPRSPTWERGTGRDRRRPGRQPAHVVRFGARGLDVQGVVPGTERGRGLPDLPGQVPDQGRRRMPRTRHRRRRRARRRLTEELRWTPCSSRCSNWLLYGVQPEGAHAELVPGCCPGKAHRRHTLGYAGRRCLVSRKWTGKKLDDYRDARRAHVMRALGAIGIRVDRDTDEDPDHTRYSWALVGPNDPDPPDRIELLLRAIHQRRRWRAQYDRARSATDDHEERRPA